MKALLKNVEKKLDSKRFFAACGATVMFTVMIYTTKYSPMELASAISLILGVYTTAESIKPSKANTQSDVQQV
jgi:hypothetical protein